MILPGILASGISGHLFSSNYYSIATITISGSSTTYATFNSIPSTYTHLQLRYTARSLRAAYTDSLFVEVNGDTTNYYSHGMFGNGTTAGSYSDNGNPNVIGIIASSSSLSNIFGSGVADFLDYTNTNKYKTIRSLSASDTNNNGGGANFRSSTWPNTAAINSLSIFTNSGSNLASGSTFALYGIK